MTHLASFVATTFLLAMLPGVGQALMTKQALEGGRRQALASALGTAMGLLTWSTLAAAGLSTVVLSNPTAFTALRVLGGVVLVVPRDSHRGGRARRRTWRRARSDTTALAWGCCATSRPASWSTWATPRPESSRWHCSRNSCPTRLTCSGDRAPRVGLGSHDIRVVRGLHLARRPGSEPVRLCAGATASGLHLGRGFGHGRTQPWQPASDAGMSSKVVGSFGEPRLLPNCPEGGGGISATPSCSALPGHGPATLTRGLVLIEESGSCAFGTWPHRGQGATLHDPAGRHRRCNVDRT